MGKVLPPSFLLNMSLWDISTSSQGAGSTPSLTKLAFRNEAPVAVDNGETQTEGRKEIGESLVGMYPNLAKLWKSLISLAPLKFGGVFHVTHSK